MIPIKSIHNNPQVLIFPLVLLLGLFQWFDFFTNIRIAGKYSEFIIPPLIGLIGAASYFLLAKDYASGRRRLIRRLACLPAVLAGILSLTIFIPPMLFFTLLTINSASAEAAAYQVISPDGSRTAKVYQSYVGLVDADSRASIRVSAQWLPWLENEVFVETGGDSDWCDGDPALCMKWTDNHNLTVQGSQTAVDEIYLTIPHWLLFFSMTFLLVT